MKTSLGKLFAISTVLLVLGAACGGGGEAAESGLVASDGESDQAHDSGVYVVSFVRFTGPESDEFFREYFGFEPGTEPELALTEAEIAEYNSSLYKAWEARAADVEREARSFADRYFTVKNPGTPALCGGQGQDVKIGESGKSDRVTANSSASEPKEVFFSGCVEESPAEGFLLVLDGPMSSPLDAAYERGYVESSSEVAEAAAFMTAVNERATANEEFRAAIGAVNKKVQDRYSLGPVLTDPLVMYLKFDRH
jgi:hypothetical protein